MAALTIQLTPWLVQKLHDLALHTGKTESFYVNRALEDRLPAFEQEFSCNQRSSFRTPEEAARIKKVIEEAKRLRDEIRLTTGGISLKELKEMAEEGRR